MQHLGQQIAQSLETTWWQLQSFLPRVLIALLFLILGWLLAGLVRRGTIRLLRLLRLDTAAERTGVEDFLLRGGVRLTAIGLVGQFLYWSILLVVALAVFNTLGLTVSTLLLDEVASYLPNVLAALLIVVFGLVFARFLRGLVYTYLNNIGAENAATVGLLTQGAILAFVATLALEQLRIGGQVLVSAFQLAFGGLCLALALAFGLGGRDWAARVLERTRKGQP